MYRKAELRKAHNDLLIKSALLFMPGALFALLCSTDLVSNAFFSYFSSNKILYVALVLLIGTAYMFVVSLKLIPTLIPKCPYCDRALEQFDQILESGNCPECKRQVIDEKI